MYVVTRHVAESAVEIASMPQEVAPKRAPSHRHDSMQKEGILHWTQKLGEWPEE